MATQCPRKSAWSLSPDGGGQRFELAAMSLALAPVTVLFAYLLVRLHAFVDEPGDRSNVAWFWLTAIWLGLGPIVAISVALVREI